MRARMIHTVEGNTYPVPYGKKDQCIYSVGRRYVNEILLTGKKYSQRISMRHIIMKVLMFHTSLKHYDIFSK